MKHLLPMFFGSRENTLTLLARVCSIILVLQAGCSKKVEPPLPEPSGEATGATPTVVTSNPPEQGEAFVNIVKDSPAGNKVPATTTDSVTTAPAKSTFLAATSHTPAEIAQSLKTTGDKQAALTAIRQYATNNSHSLGELSALLKSPDHEFTLLGAEGLVALSTKEAAAELIVAIQIAQPGNTKRELASALASFSNPEAADLFIALARSSQDHDLASAIQQALGNSASGPVLAQVVQRYQASNSAEERDNLVAAIRHMQTPECIEGLVAILNEQKVVSSTDPLGLAAADTLGIIGNTNAVSYLFGHLNNLRPGDASPVYDAIGRVSNPESLPLLATVAYGQAAGSSLYTRMSAVQALGNYNSSLVSPVLNWLIQNDSNTGIQEAARVALQNSAGR